VLSLSISKSYLSALEIMSLYLKHYINNIQLFYLRTRDDDDLCVSSMGLIRSAGQQLLGACSKRRVSCILFVQAPRDSFDL